MIAGGNQLRRWLAAPWHDFPLRERLLLEASGLPALLASPPLGRRWRVFEAGPGAGFAAHWLAGRVELTLADRSAAALAVLERHFRGTPGLRLWRADLAQAGPLPAAPAHDFAFALDMLEYAEDPGLVLKHFAALLAPGAELFLTFPNLAPPHADGCCWFATSGDLARLLAEAGFERWQIHAVGLRPWARRLYAAGHEWPLAAARRLRARTPPPRSYEQTWAFRRRRRYMRAKWLLHLWWAALAAALTARGPLFACKSVEGELLGRRLAIRAWSPS